MTLDLGEVDPPIWRVLIKETVYGPYTLGQLQAFVSEDRIIPQTRLARGDGAPFVAAETIRELRASLYEKYFAKPKTEDSPKANAAHNYIIISRLNGTGESTLVRHLNTLGSFGEAMPGVYVLRSLIKLSALQKNLKALTHESDKLLIVDASSNRLGWFNLGPEADIHLSAIWDKKMDT